MVRIQVRRDTAANWTSNNPTLLAGEHGYETDTKKYKIGDGTLAWSALGYREEVGSLLNGPGALSGQGGKAIRVNAGATAWEYYTPSVGVTDHDGLTNNGGASSHATITTFMGTKGNANGLASLGADGKVPVTQLPTSVVGALEYKGSHDCSGGAYPLTPEQGWYYVCSVAGTISAVPYNIGDWMVYNGTTWDKLDNTDGVTSVAGMTGVVTLDTSNVSENASYLYYTDERAQDAIGTILVDTNSIDFTYADGTPSITADVKVDSGMMEITAAGVRVKNGTYIGIPGSSVQGDILYHNGTVFTRLGAGIAGQVLITGGSGELFLGILNEGYIQAQGAFMVYRRPAYGLSIYVGTGAEATVPTMTALTTPIGTSPGTAPGATSVSFKDGSSDGIWDIIYTASWNTGTITGTVNEMALYLTKPYAYTYNWTTAANSEINPGVAMMSRLSTGDTDFTIFTIDDSKPLVIDWKIRFTFG